ncbi:MAG TPA: hypothetical protein VI818_03785 [Candidatus Thermoplasmatota archaeon]|nr:hypothetical protein [Candidatus Thermoplasmatota archaeon]
MRTQYACLAVVPLLMGGCASTPGPSYDDYFPDADDRWTLVADGGFSEARAFHVPDGASKLIIRASFRADRGIHFTLYDPRSQISTNLAFTRAVSVDEMQWIEALAPRDGRWSIGVDCARHCQFAFGFYFSSELSSPASLDGAHTGATRRFEATSDGGVVRVHEFDVPPDTDALRLRWSLDGSDRLQATLRNPEQATRFGFTFPHSSRVENAAYEAVLAPTPGTWSIAASCEGRCHYVFAADY